MNVFKTDSSITGKDFILGDSKRLDYGIIVSKMFSTFLKFWKYN
jgi:hypothetical protein